MQQLKAPTVRLQYRKRFSDDFLYSVVNENCKNNLEIALYITRQACVVERVVLDIMAVGTAKNMGRALCMKNLIVGVSGKALGYGLSNKKSRIPCKVCG